MGLFKNLFTGLGITAATIAGANAEDIKEAVNEQLVNKDAKEYVLPDSGPDKTGLKLKTAKLNTETLKQPEKQALEKAGNSNLKQLRRAETAEAGESEVITSTKEDVQDITKVREEIKEEIKG